MQRNTNTPARRTEIRRIDLGGDRGSVVVRFRRLPRGLTNEVADFQPGSLLVQVANPMKREMLPSMVITPVEGKSGKVTGFETWTGAMLGGKKYPVIGSTTIGKPARTEEEAFVRGFNALWAV